MFYTAWHKLQLLPKVFVEMLEMSEKDGKFAKSPQWQRLILQRQVDFVFMYGVLIVRRKTQVSGVRVPTLSYTRTWEPRHLRV